MSAADLADRLARIKLVAMDVDGVLTDGRVIYVGSQEAQAFDVQDGAGVVQLRRHGIEVVWITGRGCSATERRAQELDVRLVTAAGNKEQILKAFQEERGVSQGDTLAMGDDLPDLAMARAAGVFVAPANGCQEVRDRADWVTTASGGRGAVREMCEALLDSRGLWAQVVADANG